MTPSARLLIDPWQKLQTSAMMRLQLLVESESLLVCLFEANSHCLQSEENVLFFQSGFWSYFLEPQGMLNHHPETTIAVDAV